MKLEKYIVILEREGFRRIDDNRWDISDEVIAKYRK